MPLQKNMLCVIFSFKEVGELQPFGQTGCFSEHTCDQLCDVRAHLKNDSVKSFRKGFIFILSKDFFVSP